MSPFGLKITMSPFGFLLASGWPQILRRLRSAAMAPTTRPGAALTAAPRGFAVIETASPVKLQARLLQSVIRYNNVVMGSEG